MPTETEDQRTGERIAKLLARAGIASRREVERMIAEGRIALDGVVLETPATVLGSLHGVTVDGQPVAAPAPARLFVYHKPAGLLVTEHDPAGRPIIYERLPKDLPRVVPVGRLDLATEGLLLLTTDGGVKRQLELPATGVERTYRARTYGDITQARLEELIDGIEIEGIRYGSIDANMERRTGANGWIELTLTEGKNREVRRVLEHLGLQVSRLIRTRYGPFVLGELLPGQVGEVRQVDLVTFRRALDAKRPKTEDRVAVAVREVAAPTPPPTATEPDRPLRKRAATAERAARAATPRAAKPPSGWGTRARPSRPADAGPTGRRRDDEAAPGGAARGRSDRGGARSTPDDRGRDRGGRERPPRGTRDDDTRRAGAPAPRRPRDGGDLSPERPGRAQRGTAGMSDERGRPSNPRSTAARGGSDDIGMPARTARPSRNAPGNERPARAGFMPGGVAQRGARGAGPDRRDHPSGPRPNRGPASPGGSGSPRPPRKTR